MPYQPEGCEKLANHIKDLILERVDLILLELKNPPYGRDEGVHNARKGCKWVRAALRLIRDEIGDQIYRKENIRFRDAARKLSAARDSWVMLETFDKLMSTEYLEIPNWQIQSVRQFLLENYQKTKAAERNSPFGLTEVIESLEDAKISIEQIPISRNGYSVIQSGLFRVYTRGQKNMSKAAQHHAAELFHEWRKEVKYLRHQVEILSEIQSDKHSILASDLHQLSETLGEAHDLFILGLKIQEILNGVDRESGNGSIFQLVAKEQKELESHALTSGMRIYRDTPKTFAARLSA